MELGKKTQFFIDAYNTLHGTAAEMRAAYDRFQAEDRAVWKDVERLQEVLVENPTEANAIAYAKAMQTTQQWVSGCSVHRTNLRKIDREIRGIEDALRKAFYEEHVPLLFKSHYARKADDDANADQCESPG